MRRENSGLIDLDALLKEASQPELPQSADDSLEATAPPPEQPTPPEAAPPPSAPRPPSPSPLPDDSLRAITTREKRPDRDRPTPIPWIVGLAAGITVIAIVVKVARSQDAPPPVSLGASIATVVIPPPAAAITETTNVVTGTSLSDLPPATSASAAPASAVPSSAPRTFAAPAPAAASAQIVAIADAPPAGSGDLGGAMREAVGPRSSAEVAVTAPTAGEGARQLRPSPGAVVGAISSVMPAARICLGDSEVVRNATIVFRSDGTVARVDIAGSPNVADECIRGALSKARTMPFVEDTFAARATVRP